MSPSLPTRLNEGDPVVVQLAGNTTHIEQLEFTSYRSRLDSSLTFDSQNPGLFCDPELNSCTLQFTASQGVGTELLPVWTLGSAALAIALGGESSGILSSTNASSYLAYPVPTLTTGTLRLNSSANAAFLNATLGSGPSFAQVPNPGVSEWITFRGQHFGPNSDRVTISYSSDSNTYFCLITADPSEVQGQIGLITDTAVVCRTTAGEDAGSYFITVTAGQLKSLLCCMLYRWPTRNLPTSIP
jgi:hypothetical protein